ncbi:Rho termination factor N-terminal domain-containing protein [Clostridium sp.]|uniref:Rho termination factor N-terminal domain-containing protein n=1 Tax=Clostridium sp. TaxID=1506 RepID=UPI003217A5CD
MIELQRFNVHKIVDSKEKANKLISLGFSVLKDEENVEENIKEFENMTTEKLKKLCKENELEGYSNLAKEDLIAFVKENLEK